MGGGSTLLLLGGSQAPVPTLLSASWTETGNYTCEFCGKQYKYYTPYQEHVALHAPISEYLLLLGGGGPHCSPRLWGVTRGGETAGELDLSQSLVSRCDLGHLTQVAGKAPLLSQESPSLPTVGSEGPSVSKSFSVPVSTSLSISTSCS